MITFLYRIAAPGRPCVCRFVIPAHQKQDRFKVKLGDWSVGWVYLEGPTNKQR